MDSEEGLQEEGEPSSSSGKGPPPTKRAKPLTAAEKTTRSHEAKAEGKKKELLVKKQERMTNERPAAPTPAERKARSRAAQTVEKKEASKAKNTTAKAKARSDQSVEKKEASKAKDTTAKAKTRSDQSVEKKEASKAKDSTARGKARADQSEEKKEASNAKKNAAMVKARVKLKTTVEQKEALRSQEILQGIHQVKDLNDTEDSIGKMDTICEECGAFKFKKETGTTCCNNGKVQLPAFPKPPDEINRLWHDQTPEGKLFRQNARHINNSVCISSIKINERHMGFQPTVVFQGRLQHRVGPLQAEEGEIPRFVQLYVHDASLENSQRFKNMYIPTNMSQPQRHKLEQILNTVQEALHTNNPFIKDFKQIMEIGEDQLPQGKIVISAKSRPSGEHSRRYNEQLNLQEVSILTNSEPHDLVLEKRGGGLHTISDLNPKGMPLHFTLLFPHGTFGWDPNTPHKKGKRRVTTREFYTYHLNQRDLHGDYLQLAGRLFQEWICMAWVVVESQRLNFQRQNQKALRADTYKNVKEATEERRRDLAPREDGMYPDDNQRPGVGRKILSSSFVGSPRWFNAQLQDGMAICREYHKPDLFITMTCNPNWPEIKEQLKPGQTAQDRPDLVARVFKHKFDQLMNDLIAGEVLGKVVAHMHVIEFQKRGLPHAHILLILAAPDRKFTPDLVDSIVVAELPLNPEYTEDIEEKEQRERLQKIVLSNMIHGPCGKAKPDSPCMENGRCTKNFPKDFQKQTVVDKDSNYPKYRRRSPEDGGRQVVCEKTGRIIDNRWVVPYIPFLSLRNNCHINGELCTSPKAAKYLYGYITKGCDRAMVATVVEGDQARDEIRQYEDLRSVGSSEAVWHLLAFPISRRYPPVQALRVHTEDQQQVVFDEGTEEVALETQRETELTAFFRLNEQLKQDDQQVDVESLQRYVDMPKLYRYDKTKKTWIRRQARSEDKVIGRVHSVNPLAGETFYLRMLLHDDHSLGKTSFNDMKTLPTGSTCETFQEVCRELGLLKDDQEWQRVLTEAANTRLCPQLRELYVVILMFCLPSNPRGLFDEFWETWVEDFQHQGQRKGLMLDEAQLRTMLLLDLELRLQSFEKELADFGLPVPTVEDLNQVENVTSTEPVVIREERDYDVSELADRVNATVPKFTQEQSDIYERVQLAVKEGEQLLAFIDARGGCGKTFMTNVILSSVRSSEPGGCVALATATTGIAANLLDLGRTFHSRLKAPLTLSEESTLQISGQSSLAKLVRMAKLILIDEATMLDRLLLEALDRSLRDLMNQQNKPFGGKTLLLAGDFRQCLPVVKGANRAQTTSHCINKSYLWKHFKILRLTENMRVRASGDPELEAFDQWTLSIGNGDNDDEAVLIPDDMVTEIVPNTPKESWHEEESMKKFCKLIFPDLETNISNPGWLEGRAILTPTNSEVSTINEMMQQWVPGNITKLSSADTLENPNDAFRFNSEYLNTLQPNGFPQHILTLKAGIPLMLLRNINPRQGLCNGTRLIYDKTIDSKLLQCRIVGSERVVLIPRITFIPKAGDYPFEWQRRQFPVRIAFATTINKSQGQSLKKVGVWLRGQVFGHGQLYVACSRVSAPSQLKFAIMRDSAETDKQLKAKNIVYKEILLT